MYSTTFKMPLSHTARVGCGYIYSRLTVETPLLTPVTRNATFLFYFYLDRVCKQRIQAEASSTVARSIDHTFASFIKWYLFSRRRPRRMALLPGKFETLYIQYMSRELWQSLSLIIINHADVEYKHQEVFCKKNYYYYYSLIIIWDINMFFFLHNHAHVWCVSHDG